MFNLASIKTKINYYRFKTVSYSQEGEDCVLNRIFNNKKNGFYVDVGAHHPVRFSNTYLFYKKGWSGINVDAMPGSMRDFNLLRGKDTNLECPVSNSTEEITYYMFNEPALNGFSESLSVERNKLSNYFITNKIKLTPRRLEDILKQNLKDQQEIDFLNVDVEGLDLEVLKSNNWTLFRPRVIIVELLNTEIEEINKNEIYAYLKKQNYKLIGKTFNTGFFQRI